MSEFNPIIMEYTKNYDNFANEHLFNQSMLVERLFKEEVFALEDVQNFWNSEEECKEVFQWLYAPNFEADYFTEKMDKAQIPYLKNDYGIWIGRTSFGQSWTLDIVPELVKAFAWYEIYHNDRSR